MYSSILLFLFLIPNIDKNKESFPKQNTKYFKSLQQITKTGDVSLKNKIIYVKVPISAKKNK
tara:strand:- start:58 stop:243 length:186 start_codon:yes stop_codon:yes gene_type:complete